ncbi:MAG: XrtN system VIT domain-containing protein [Bacteroidia bacterium]|nr:XrtN system VIT domain-containing protein [Bacteroidia bacterium]
MPKYPKLYMTGLISLAVSLIWFLLLIYSPILESNFIDELGAFFVNYGISFLYFIAILINYVRNRKGVPIYKGDEHVYSIALVLFSISAHSLNFSEVKIFSPYVDWMIAYVILMHVAVLLFPFRELLSDRVKIPVYFINGAGLVLALYLTFFVLPIYILAIPAGILFGLSLHVLVPFWFLLYFIQAWFRMDKAQWSKRSFIIGALLPLLAFSLFAYQWSSIQKKIKSAEQTYSQLEDKSLPKWVFLASALPSDLLTQKVMMASGQTQRTYWQSDDFLGSGPRGNEFTKHDPLALAAISIYGELDMSRWEKIKVFQAQYDCRHMTHRRLWSGEQLITKQVESEIDLYPSYRLAYEQMTLTIHHENKRSPDWWIGDSEEAVYSFYLPEGSIATSLSLWINGVEEKSRLTTKSKADSAYRTIVGRERRDPALMHWQEGNRVTVTVFPCTPEEDRVFKLGYTTPLRFEDGKLFLKHVSFDGPATWRAGAKIRLRFPRTGKVPEKLDLPRFWKVKDSVVMYEDLYQPDWEISFEAPELKKNTSFEWKGQLYHVSEATADPQSWKADKIILDVNSSWTWARYKQVFDELEEKNLWAYLPDPIQLNKSNYKEVYNKLKERSFSLLPLYKSEEGEKILVISASNGHGPILKDLKNTVYANSMVDYFKEKNPDIQWFSFSHELPPYIKSLHELRLVSVNFGIVNEILTRIQSEQIEVHRESDSEKYISISQMKIQRDTSNEVSGLSLGAPDHLYRLFAYQELMSGIGSDYFDKKRIETEWIKTAESAYIVSPMSSLIVLETQKDYERFDIKKNKDTVGNAGIEKAAADGNGAVPEPHEWVLIVCMSLTVTIIGLKKWMLKH